MSTESNSESVPEIPQSEFTPTLEELEIIEANFRKQQDVLYGIIAGAAAALISALLWAYITVATEHQVGYMAIGVGAFVGISIRYLGAGIDMKFGLIGAFFALLGCVLGNLLSQVGFIAHEEGSTYIETLGILKFSDIPGILKRSFTLLDVVFYSIAVYGGYRFAFRMITTNDMIAAQQGNQSPPPFSQFRAVAAIALLLAISFCIYYVVQAMSFKKTTYYESGLRKQEGMIEYGLQEGEWKFYYESGSIESKGFFLEGKLDSVWENYDQGGTLIRTAHYKKGVKDGPQIEYYAEGKIQSQGTFKNGRQNGEAIYYYRNGQIAQKGSYVDNFSEGLWEYYYENATPLATGSLHKNAPVGKWTYWNDKGVKTREVNFRDDGEALILNTWDDEGHPGIVNGNGHHAALHFNGELAETGQIANGQRQGVWKKYYETGKLQEEGEYTSGKYFMTASYSPTGEPNVQKGNGTYLVYLGTDVVEGGMIKNGVKSGKWKRYVPGSTIVSEEGNYMDGKLNGSYKTYYNDGTVHSEGEMLDGNREGTWNWYYDTGMLERTVTYMHGKKDGKEEFYDAAGILNRWETYEAGELVEKEEE